MLSNKTNPSVSGQSASSFLSFVTSIILRLRRNGQYKSAQNYRATLNSFMRFRANIDLAVSGFDAAIVESYEAYLKQTGVCRNTMSFYMRILRAIYNRAVECGQVAQSHPFRHVYTGIDKTRKRAVPFSVVKHMCKLRLADTPSCDMARDAFLLSFFLRGISFVDLAHLKKTDLRDGFLHYVRSKTHQPITIRWEPPMQAMVDKYSHLTASSPYLFPFLVDSRSGNKTPAQLYHNAEARIAYHLKHIGHLLGLQQRLTLYVARHSWATAVRDHHCPLSVISEALGHDSETTTQIYLQSIQMSEIDQVNAELLAELEL